MASSIIHFLLTFLALSNLVFLSKSEVTSTRAPFKPNGLVLPVYKDSATGLHIANITKRTPQRSLPFLIDLNGRFLWVNCETNYLSNTYFAPFCRSTQCSRAGVHSCNKCFSPSPRPGCHNNTCAVTTTNPLTRQTAISEIAQDSLSIQSISTTQGSNTGPLVTIRHFLFACSPSSLLQGPLPRNVQGVAGLGHDSVSLPIQLASHFGLPRQFALCLPSSSQKNGAIFFGASGSYETQPGLDVSRNLTYTPLIIGAQGEYFIPVRSIRVNNKPVPLNRSSLISTRSQNFGGAKISTIRPYTVLEHNIFTAFTQFFANQLSGVSRVNPISPFGLCFNSNNLTSTNVPNIDFVMQNRNVTWTITRANSMVQARPGVSCLAFVDGGENRKNPIVIGVHQLEDNFVQFDLVKSRLGFSSSLLSRNTSCSNFNFTTSTSFVDENME
ncbi:gamma conglutin 1-like [Nicotiana tomentosiformis]|uniref:gamma conglutin 1-like n=1 Tax=Nicotiana tomentosiformis TaxID=4098 RepID=UPI00051C8154|nr:basic 7S globulin-like [Nicotiana tomentosiformis]